MKSRHLHKKNNRQACIIYPPSRGWGYNGQDIINSSNNTVASFPGSTPAQTSNQKAGKLGWTWECGYTILQATPFAERGSGNIATDRVFTEEHDYWTVQLTYLLLLLISALFEHWGGSKHFIDISGWGIGLWLISLVVDSPTRFMSKGVEINSTAIANGNILSWDNSIWPDPPLYPGRLQN